MDTTPQTGGAKRMQIARDLARVGLTYDDGGSASAAGNLGPGQG